MEDALDYLHEAQTIFRSFLTNETKNDFVLSGTAETYSAMGLAHVALAQRAKSTTSQREEHWREARAWFRRSLDIWLDMRGRGALAKVDNEKPQEMMQHLATCDAALRRLTGSHSKAI